LTESVKREMRIAPQTNDDPAAQTSWLIQPRSVLQIFWACALITTIAHVVSFVTSSDATILAGYYSFLLHGVVFIWTVVVLATGKTHHRPLLGVIGWFALEGVLFVFRLLRDLPVG
jgi:hypothetical protein